MTRKTLQRIVWDDGLERSRKYDDEEEIFVGVISGKSIILYIKKPNSRTISRLAPSDADYYAIGNYANEKNKHLIQYYRKRRQRD